MKLILSTQRMICNKKGNVPETILFTRSVQNVKSKINFIANFAILHCSDSSLLVKDER